MVKPGTKPVNREAGQSKEIGLLPGKITGKHGIPPDPERGSNMIEVTRLNNKRFIINCEWIETVEATPDTVITLTNGKKFVVAEGVEDIIRKVVEYKQKIMFRTGNQVLRD